MGQPKTGLSNKIREVLQNRKFPLSSIGLCKEMGIPPGRERQRVRNTLTDFEMRGEASRTPTNRWRYNHKWKRGDKTPLKDRIIKAIYVSNAEFTMAEIRVRAGVDDASYVHKVSKQLVSGGYIKQVRTQLCLHGAGSERLFNITNRERFRVDMMK